MKKSYRNRLFPWLLLAVGSCFFERTTAQTTYCGPAQATVPVPTDSADVILTFTYGVDPAANTLNGELVYNQLGWLGIGTNPNGLTMQGTTAIIGLPAVAPSSANPGLYNLRGYDTASVALQPVQPETQVNSVSQNATHTVLTVTNLPVLENGQVNILMAAGSDNTLAHHRYRHGATIILEPCAADNPQSATTVPATGGPSTMDPTTTATTVGPSTVTPSTVAPTTLQVGDSIVVEGYIMDQFCILRGSFLDNPELPSLLNPDKHTVHCLMDPEQCYNSTWEVLTEPAQAGQPYVRGYTLDAASKEKVIGIVQSVGVCEKCGEGSTGTIREGFRARLASTVVDLGNAQTGSGPLISVSDALALFPAAEEATQAATPVATTMAPTYPVGTVLPLVEGFVMDFYCINRGTLLDNPTVATLADPNLHSVHCLVDVQPCLDSGFEILSDPVSLPDGQRTTSYTRGYVLDVNAKNQAINLARAVGICTTCTGAGALQRGFRVRLMNSTVVALGDAATETPPTIGIADAAQMIPVYYFGDASTPTTLLKVGDYVTAIGYVMDRFCIDRGTLLDNPTMPTLSNPNVHSLHCLIDVEQCAASNYELLLDPSPDDLASDPNTTIYTRGFVLDQAGKDLVRGIAQQYGECDTCTGGGTWKQGFRVQINGVVEALGAAAGEPPVVRVETAIPVRLEGDSEDGTDAPTTEVNVPYSPDGANNTDFAQQCPEGQTAFPYVGKHVFADIPIMFDWEVNMDATTGVGNFSARVVYDGVGWVGFGFNTDESMIGALAVIGTPGAMPGKYMLGAKAPTGVTLSPNQTLLAADIQQDTQQTVLTFTKLLEEPGEIPINLNGPNFFLVAGGGTNDISHHIYRGAVEISLPPCSVQSYEDEVDGSTSCHEGSYTMSGGGPLSFTYKLDQANGTFHGEVTYGGTGWVGFAVSPNGAMIGSSAVIGMPAQPQSPTNPGYYSLGSKDLTNIFLLDPADGVTIGTIVQNGTHTVMQFQIPVDNVLIPGLSINSAGVNNFLLAAGATNDFVGHQFRDSFQVDFAASCSDAVDLEVVDVGTDAGVDAGDESTCEEKSSAGVYQLENTPLTFQYDLDRETGVLWGEVVYAGAGWVALGISETGQMVGSIAIIGVPSQPVSATNPGFYDLLAKVPPTPVVLMSPQPAINGGNVAQNATHTSMTFSVPLSGLSGSPHAVNPDGNNMFLMAAGTDNNLASHLYRGSFNVDFSSSSVPGCEKPEWEIGEVINIEGFVVDNYCISLGYFLDNNSTKPLEAPNLHSLHCLLDVDPCVNSNWEVLLDPEPGESLYRRGFTLDNESKAAVMAIARSIGVCNTCTGEGRLERGFRVKLSASIVDLGNAATGAPPTITVFSAVPVFYITESSTVAQLQVGDSVTVDGFVMDQYCISLGTLLEDPTVVTLQEPYKHTVKCLLDEAVCRASAFEILLDPPPGSNTLYTRGFQLDDASKTLVTELAQTTGVCQNCTGAGTLERGFRIHGRGSVAALGAAAGRALQQVAPVLSLVSATPDPSVLQVTADPSTPAPGAVPVNSSAVPSGPVDCTQYQSSYSFGSDNIPITVNYVVTADEASQPGLFSAQVVYEGQGWVGFAFSPSGSMIGSLAVIGLPDEAASQSNPGKYDLSGLVVDQVTLSQQQTLMSSSIVQNATHTVLEFKKLLTEPGETPIDPNGANNFLVAAGSSNPLAYHQYRGAVRLTLAPCTAAGGGNVGGAAEQIDTGKPPSQTLLRSHGIMAALAWGLLAPLAIGSALGRHLIPRAGLWFDIHRGANIAVLVFTILAFATAFRAIGASTGGHFQSQPGSNNKHRSIGLFVFLLVTIQVGGGLARPHLPEVDDNGEPKEEKTKLRSIWEVVHRGSAVLLVLLSWYQIHTGLVHLRALFNTWNYVGVFWGLNCLIWLAILAAFASKFYLEPPAPAGRGNKMSSDEEAEDQPLTNDDEAGSGNDATGDNDNDAKSPDGSGEEDNANNNKKDSDDPEAQLNSTAKDGEQFDDEEGVQQPNRDSESRQSFTRSSSLSVFFKKKKKLDKKASSKHVVTGEAIAEEDEEEGNDQGENENNDANDESSKTPKEASKKGGFFSRMFGRKKKEEPEEEGGETSALLDNNSSKKNENDANDRPAVIEEGDEEGQDNSENNGEGDARAAADDDDGTNDNGETAEKSTAEPAKKGGFFSKFGWGSKASGDNEQEKADDEKDDNENEAKKDDEEEQAAPAPVPAPFPAPAPSPAPVAKTPEGDADEDDGDDEDDEEEEAELGEIPVGNVEPKQEWEMDDSSDEEDEEWEDETADGAAAAAAGGDGEGAPDDTAATEAKAEEGESTAKPAS